MRVQTGCQVSDTLLVMLMVVLKVSKKRGGKNTSIIYAHTLWRAAITYILIPTKMLQQRFRCHRRDLKHFVNLFDGCCLRTHQCLHWEVLWKCGEEGWIQEKKRRRIKTESDPGQVRHSFPSALGGHAFVPRTPRRSQSMRQLQICRPPLKKKEKKKNSSVGITIRFVYSLRGYSG